MLIVELLLFSPSLALSVYCCGVGRSFSLRNHRIRFDTILSLDEVSSLLMVLVVLFNTIGWVPPCASLIIHFRPLILEPLAPLAF